MSFVQVHKERMIKLRCCTFSITARCPNTGKLGVAVCGPNVNVRARVPHVRAKVGAIATQGKSNPALGTEGIKLLERGFSAASTLNSLLSKDSEKEERQLLIIDAYNEKAAYTGSTLPGAKGHIIGDNFVVGGSILRNDSVLTAMAEAFTKSSHLIFELRLLISLENGQKAGGDTRGAVSAALLVVGLEESSLIDIYIDDSPDPLVALRRMLSCYI